VTGAPLQLVPVLRTSLVQNDEEGRLRFTNVRMTDARAAIQFGLKQYLEDLSIDFAGRRLSFKHVRQTWAEPEDNAEYPSAGIFSDEEGNYGDEEGSNSKLSPGLLSEPIEGVPDAYAMIPMELVQVFKLQVWTTDPKERTAICAMVEDAFNPVSWMYGFKLKLPHYHNATALYEPIGSLYEESDDDSRRRFRKITFRIKATVPVIRVFYNQKKGSARVQLSVSDLGSETSPTQISDTGACCDPIVESLNPFKDPGPPGRTGPVGPEGPIGPSGGTVERVAEIALSSHRVVRATSNTDVNYCDARQAPQVWTALGITLTAAGLGAPIYVMISGEIEEVSWTWAPGGAIFCGNDGVLTQTDDPAWAWLRVVAVAETATKIVVQLRDPIAR